MKRAIKKLFDLNDPSTVDDIRCFILVISAIPSVIFLVCGVIYAFVFIDSLFLTNDCER